MTKKFLPIAIMAAVMAMFPAAQAATVFCNQVGGYNPGIYSFPTEGGALQEVYAYSGLDSKYGGVFTDNAYYCVQYLPGSFYTQIYAIKSVHNADLSEWTAPTRLNEKLSVTDVPTALVWNDITGNICGSFMNEDKETFSFGLFSVTDGTSSVIAPLSQQLVTLAADETGQMFAIGADGILYSVTTAGVLTEIGATGVSPSPKYASGSAFDDATGTLYWAVTNKSLDTFLYTVDTATGAATQVYAFPDNTILTSLFIPDAPASAAAPADIEDFTAVSDGFLDKVDVSFTLPSKTIAGEDMLGAVKYKLMVDGSVLADSQGGPGQKVEVTATPGEGEHVVTLFISNAAGKGNRCVARVYVGEDSPGTVTGLTISVDGNDITVAWQPPVVGMHGGNFNADALAYNVIRDNDGTTVSERQIALSYSETVESTGLAKVSYTVVPVCGNLVGPASQTESVMVGTGMTPPYEQTFDSADSFDDIYFSTYDANNDGKGWTLYKNYYGTAGNARYEYSSDNDADDWLFTCPLDLQKDYRYTVQFTLDCNRWGNGERLEVKYGPKPDVASMTYQALPETDFEKGTKHDVEAIVDPQQSGTFYLGFHITSGADSYNVDLDNLKILSGIPSSLEMARALPAGYYVRGYKGGLEIMAEDNAEIRIADLSGRVVRDIEVPSGRTRTSLDSGIYVVMVNDSAIKVCVR